MKAVIMAGGEGSRLRPMTCDIPKPMAPLLNRPMIEYILDLLNRHNTSEACVTTQYLPDLIYEHFPNNSYKNMKLTFAEETTPLGTAGSVKNAAQNFGEDFLVISGDALCDFDLSAAMAFHKEKNALATLIVTKVEDPREYGLVNFDQHGTIKSFLEKPDYSQAATNFANTGIYILSPRVLARIPGDTFYDFGKNVFPGLLADRERMIAYVAEGYWCDIGDLSTYASCQFDMLNKKVTYEAKSSSLPHGDFTINEPCLIASSAVIESGAVIGPKTVIGEDVFVGAGSKIRDSILHKNAHIGQEVTVNGAVICKNAVIKNKTNVFEGAVIGGEACVGERVTVDNGVKIWPQKKVADHSIVRENVKFGQFRNDVFDDKGISGEVGVELTPDYLCRLGACLGSLKGITRIGAASAADKAARALKRAFLSGVQGAGATGWDFGSVFEGTLNFALNFCSVELGVYISTVGESAVKITSVSGLPLPRDMEREAEGLLSRNEYKRCSWDKYKDVVEMSGIRHLYINEVIKNASLFFPEEGISVESRNPLIKNTAADILQKLGCAAGTEHVFTIESDGRKASYRYKNEETVEYEKLLALACLEEFLKGGDVALPYDAPMKMDELAEEYGHSVLRYVSCPSDSSDKEARWMAESQMWERDALMLCIKVLSFAREQGNTIPGLLKQVPGFSTLSREIELSCNACDLLGRMSEKSPKEVSAAEEGVLFKTKDGTVKVRPNKRGNALKLFAEANTEEIAAEIAGEFERLMK